MHTALLYLALVTAFTGLLWMPYVLNRIVVRGITDTVGYPEDPKPQAAWAQRLSKAHSNAIENLVVFAALILVAHALGIGGTAVAEAAIVYFWARVAHAASYTFAVPWLRTLTFAVGFAAQVVVAWEIFAHWTG